MIDREIPSAAREIMESGCFSGHEITRHESNCRLLEWYETHEFPDDPERLARSKETRHNLMLQKMEAEIRDRMKKVEKQQIKEMSEKLHKKAVIARRENK